MTDHSFNIEVANIVGVNAAILFKNISHWCEKNKANNKHFYDGEYWTYNGIKAFEILFPYLSAKQIKTALDKLNEFDFIGFGEYNQNPYDRTRWYCDLTQKVGLNMFLSNMLKCKMEIAEMSNVEEYKRSSSITDINTDSKPNNKHLNLITETSSGSQNTDATVKEKKPMTLYQKFVDVWLKEYREGWKFTAIDGKKMKSMIGNIERSLKNHGSVITEDSCVDLFRQFLNKLPDFYKTKSLSILESNYDSIIEEIKNGNNKPKQQYQSTANRISASMQFFRDL